VIAFVAANLVIAGAAVEGVISGGAGDGVVVFVAGDVVVAIAADESIVACAAGNGVVAVNDEDAVVAGAAGEVRRSEYALEQNGVFACAAVAVDFMNVLIGLCEAKRGNGHGLVAGVAGNVGDREVLIAVGRVDGEP